MDPEQDGNMEIKMSGENTQGMGEGVWCGGGGGGVGGGSMMTDKNPDDSRK